MSEVTREQVKAALLKRGEYFTLDFASIGDLCHRLKILGCAIAQLKQRTKLQDTAHYKLIEANRTLHERIRELEAGITDALTALRGAGTGMSGDRILSGVEAMLMTEAALSKALAGEKEQQHETPDI